MRIERKPHPEMTLAQFADAHELTLVIEERAMDKWQQKNRLHRYMARFRGVEINGDGVLASAYGSGNSEQEAIDDYREQISNERLVVDAFKDSRREITAPRLVAGAE